MTTLLTADTITKRFAARGMFRRGRPVQAVTEVSLSVARGETLGLVGESGSGKSTIGRMVLGLLPPSSGQVHFDGIALDAAGPAQRRQLRRRMQIVFQDPHSSLDPRRTIGAQIADGLSIHALVPAGERRARVEALLTQVGLPGDHADRYPHEFSGGQRQRVGIARALALEPEIIIADEPISALDVSIQAQIVLLLQRLQQEKGLTYLFIAHDLAMVKYLSDRVGVMYLGQLAELASSDELYANPLHPYTQALLSAIPVPDPDLEKKRQRILLKGELPSAINPPSGCVFHTRCPQAQDICRQQAPAWKEHTPGHFAACHLIPEENR